CAKEAYRNNLYW
nr:immunoglobulin heavy chain junction region [Macaca mulatta]